MTIVFPAFDGSINVMDNDIDSTGYPANAPISLPCGLRIKPFEENMLEVKSKRE